MKIFDYEEVKMNWDSFTYPIAVGTPVSIDGVLADNASAHGLIARTVFAKPDADETLKVMTGGIIDMEEIVAGYGQELSSAAVQALCGIHFYKDGVCIPSGGSGGGGVTPEIMAQIENAQWKTEGTELLFSETVTTALVDGGFNVAILSYSGQITADTLKVTFNGVEYTCEGSGDSSVKNYGAPFNSETESYDFSEYPFGLGSDGDNYIVTESPGTYTISVSAETVSTTETFNNEVNSLIDSYLSDLGGVVNETTNPDEALFCTVKINGFAGVDNVMLHISNTGEISLATTNVMPTAFRGSLVLASYNDPLSGDIVFTNGSSVLVPPHGLTSGRLYLNGLISTVSSADAVSFTCSVSTNASYSDLEVHYFAVKSNSDDSGGDSSLESIG